MTPLHEAARAWAKAGFAVFPCSIGAKTPATTNGLKDATTDLSQIDRWWAQADYNIGVAPEHTGMYVLDVDPPLGGETLASLVAHHGALPDTLMIGTPRGGHHYWFIGDCPSTVSRLGPKLDTRGQGGYVLVPPSVVDGNPYTYESETDEIAEGPTWIAAAIAESREAREASGVEIDLPANVARARSLLRDYVSRGEVAVEGSGGDSKTYQVACEILNLGLSPRAAFDVMWEDWAPHCQPFNPSWFEDFLKTKIVNAAEYAQNEQGAWAVPPAAELFAKFVSTECIQIVDKNRSKFYPEDEDEQDRAPEPSWLLPDLLPAESTVMIYGPSGSYKSFIALDLLLTLASGITGWGCDARAPMPVVYVPAEGPRSIKRLRRPAWRQAHEITSALPFYVVSTMPLVTRPEEVGELIEAIKARGIAPGVICIDTLARAMAGMNENDAKDAGIFIEAIEAIKRTFGCTVIVVHHTGKEEGRGARGSSALAAGFDTTIEVQAHQATKAVSVHVRKQKDADTPETPFTLEGRNVGPSLVFFQTDTRTHKLLTDKDDTFSPSKVGAALRELAALSPAAAVSTHVLATHVCPQLTEETPEQRSLAVSRFTRRLGMLAHGKLEAYTTGEGRTLRWFIPASIEEA